ncbi:hypothetical protein MPTK1_1g02470 [Marchantia polymorpha subsp. ruderalis]|uniref:DUF247 domain-containing protein n=2 Tax=Marchantia polymorpha TaxID=3197 RepID=A0AAF6AKQ9_MARPO|nr:hypothetical protein MARPO_2873s0001 [Marchantia polymorpha]BBM97029.1 hypothetical protein Mp_1g02470 [Marchantia polymorpha subsp. ruderalis]|eukprot:PTQ26316.1 hypothetical protein MARPO_2873s0001 [Marchantia polymorpha]
MAAQASEERNDCTSASAEGEEKWTHVVRIDEELKRVAEKMAPKPGAGRRAMPTILRASHAFREHGQFGYEFRYDPVYMRLGLYSRGALLAPTAAETRRMEAAIAFLKKLNARRAELKLRPISWHEMCARVVPSPARVRWLWSDAPSDMTDDDVRHLLAIDAVFMLCYYQTMGDKFPQVQEVDRWEDVWREPEIVRDFLLMENQIPLVLIQNALALALEGEHREHAERDRVINPSPEDDERVDLVCAKDFHPEVHELLSSVLEDVLKITGLPRFYDDFVPRDVIVSSDHLLDLVYRVVAKKYRTPDVDSDDSPRPGSNSTRSVGALIRCGEKSAYFFQKLMIYLRHLQCVLPTRLVAAFGSRSQDCQEEEEDRWRDRLFIPTASKLRKAGIAVKGLSQKHAMIWDYKMEQGLFTDTLWIPKLDIWDSTANSLRNLLLMEQGVQSLLYREWQPLMEYLAILKQLVDTREDVVILCGNTNDYVILNMVGDAGIVAKLINDLDRGCWSEKQSRRFLEFCKEVRQCCNRRRKRWLWQFVETYLNKPWKIASLLAAILLLVLTALQTIYSMLSFYGI